MPNRARLPKHWVWLRATILERDGFKCVRCGSRNRLEVDHIEPGDNHAPDNLQTLCRNCHITKTANENRIHHVEGQRDWEAAMSRGRNRFARLH